MYSMKEACELTDMTYENLKFYCNEGHADIFLDRYAYTPSII